MKAKAPNSPSTFRIRSDYFRRRDFEIVQPLYDLAFLLEVGALSSGAEPPKYRTFSLWRAAYSLDGYSTVIDRWMDGALQDQDLDYVPSSRIRQYLTQIRETGTLAELSAFERPKVFFFHLVLHRALFCAWILHCQHAVLS